MIDTITLQSFIEQLRRRPLDQYVAFDFCGMCPVQLQSSRGFNTELALGFHPYDSTTVGKLLKELEHANGATFKAYKGGKHIAGSRTEVWVDNWGEWTATAITGVTAGSDVSVIMTQWAGE